MTSYSLCNDPLRTIEPFILRVFRLQIIKFASKCPCPIPKPSRLIIQNLAQTHLALPQRQTSPPLSTQCRQFRRPPKAAFRCVTSSGLSRKICADNKQSYEEEEAEFARDEQYILRTKRDIIRKAEDVARMLEDTGRVMGEESDAFRKIWDQFQELAQMYLRVDKSLENMQKIRRQLQQLRERSG